MVELEKPRFDVAGFLASAGLGRRIIQLAPKEAFFSQGNSADSVFYLQKGSARVTVVSPAGKEATIALLSAGDFVGEEALAAIAGLRLATATAITACTTLRISREEMIRVMHVEHSFSDLFLKVILERSMRIRPTWSISFSTPVKSGLRGYFCYWRNLASLATRNNTFPRSRRRPWLK